MAEVGSTVFTVDDLIGGLPSFLEAVRAGRARLEDLDGTNFAVLPEERLAALTDIVRWATQHLLVEALLRKPASDRSVGDFGESPWLQVFDDEDLSTFSDELGDAVLLAANQGSTTDLLRLVSDWRVTAEVLADPEGREILLGRYEDSDFVEVTRPD